MIFSLSMGIVIDQRGACDFTAVKDVLYGEKLFIHPKRRFWILSKTESKDWPAPVHIRYSIFLFLPDLAFANLKNTREIKVLSGSVEGTENFSSIVNDGPYVNL